MPAPTPLLRLTGVSFAVSGEVLLRPASLSLGAGQVLALRGPNGSGKTTLLRIAAGQIPPSSGHAQLFGRRPDERDAQQRRRLAALIGPVPLARDMTLAEHLALIARSWGASPAAARRAAGELLEELEIPGLERRFPHELSSGQLQLVSIAMLLARPAEVLLVDEPEQRLDEERRTLVAAALQRRCDAGASLLFATHSEHLVTVLKAGSAQLPDSAGGRIP